MIKKILISTLLFTSCASFAQEGSRYLSVSFGKDLFKNNDNYILDLGYEKVRTKHNSHVFGINAYKKEKQEEFLLYYNVKTSLLKAKNTIIYLGFDFNAGHNVGDFIFGPGINFEIQKSISQTIILFVNQNSKALVSANNLFRHQTSFGFKINL